MAAPTLPGLNQIANPNTYTQGPNRLTSVFPVKPVDARGILSGVTYEIDFCGDTASTAVDFDDFADCIRTADKEFAEGLLYTDSWSPGAFYNALKCRPGALGGGSEDDYKARAQRRLLHSESTYLETALQTKVVADGTSVTTTGDVIKDVGKLLVHSTSVNNPVLHLPIDTAFQVGTLGLQTITQLGVQLVISPIYTDLLLTGALNIWGGLVAVNSTATDLVHNYLMAIAEREYVMAYDCDPFYMVAEGS